MRVKVGPIGLRLQGVMTVQEKNRYTWPIVSRVGATDRWVGGGIWLNVRLTLDESALNETELQIVSEVRLMGKPGEFGQAATRRKADTLVAGSAKNVAAHFGP